tara:strand:- start:1904 stop:2185 length:282 start_codon:yes stop_codon:yes gene_type:complete
MKVKEIMERCGSDSTGLIIAYIKDALEEIAITSETHVATSKINIVDGKRFYDLPKEALNVLDVRCKDHDNEDGVYRSIPRSIYEPATEDTDGV